LAERGIDFSYVVAAREAAAKLLATASPRAV
jgi:hypothetical protein